MSTSPVRTRRWPRRLKALIVGALSGFGLLIILPIMFMLAVSLPDVFSYATTDFDRAKWDASNPFASHTRTRMVNDLLEDDRLVGLVFDEVATLLGEADTSHTSGTTQWLGYWTGPPRGFIQFDNTRLMIVLENGRVTEAGLINT